MTIKQVCAVYFSPVGGTEHVVRTIAEEASRCLSVLQKDIDFTTTDARQKAGEGGFSFDGETLVVFGTPTYAGRVPNKVLPFVQELFHGNDTPAIAVTTFGNRSFDSSLTELTQELNQNGFRVFAAVSQVCRHVFSPDKLAPGRPDEADLEALRAFARKACDKLRRAEDTDTLQTPVIRDGAPVAPYYTPLGTDGKPAVFLKAKPKTDEDKCIHCRICVEACPMGSIDDDCTTVSGICIKCQACVRKCPTEAKYFDDAAFLSHVMMLEANYTRRAESGLYG